MRYETPYGQTIEIDEASDIFDRLEAAIRREKRMASKQSISEIYLNFRPELVEEE